MTAQPNFFIVGAPRCGTTAMHNFLKQHPDIFLPEVKELHYFGSDLEFRSPTTLQSRTWDQYLAKFGGWNGETRVGEASVFYLASTRAAQEIHDYQPDARIIIMLRNPVDVMYSRYYHMHNKGSETYDTFEDALAAEERRKQGEDIPEFANWVGTLFYREIVRYAPQVKRYFKIFGREQVHIIIYDDFRADLPGVYRETLAFLGVDADFQAEFAVINAARKPRFMSVRRFLKYPPSWYMDMLKLGRQVLPTEFRQRVNVWIKETNAISIKRPSMKPETRQQLMRECSSDIDALSDLLGRDLRHWVHFEQS